MRTIERAELNVVPIKASSEDTYLNDGELDVLIALLRSVNPRRVLEIGVNVGLTAAAVLAAMPGIERYIGVDVPPEYEPIRAWQKQEIPIAPGSEVIDDRFRLIVRPRGSLDLTAAELMPCDAVFIDGDHGRWLVLHDSEFAEKIVPPSGIIIWHDYVECESHDVRAVLDELAASDDSITHVRGTWLVFKRCVG